MDNLNIFCVGGAIRDLIMGNPPSDYDFVVVGATPQQMLDLGFSHIGKDFPVFLHPEFGWEFALARTERKVGVGYTGFEVDFDSSVTLEQDTLRRDLTINSLACRVLGWEGATPILSDRIIDYFGGIRDIEDKLLRPVSEHFKEDPVRVLRAGRFLARFPDFTPTVSLYKMCEQILNNGELRHLVPERIYLEFEKTMTEKAPLRLVDFLLTIRGKDGQTGFDEIFVGGMIRDGFGASVCRNMEQISLLDIGTEDKILANFARMTCWMTVEEIHTFCKILKSPNFVLSTCLRVNAAHKMLNDTNRVMGEGEHAMQVLETLDVMRTGQHNIAAFEAALVNNVGFKPVWLSQLQQMKDVIHAVGINDIPIELHPGKRITLTMAPPPGKEIAVAIRQARVWKLSEFIGQLKEKANT